MATTHQQASTTSSGGRYKQEIEISPAYCCTSYFGWIILSILSSLIAVGMSSLSGDGRCFFELYAHSVSVSNTNASTTDWNIGFVATSPVTGCKISLRRIKSSLLLGKDVISESPPSSDLFGQFVASYKTERPVTTLGFSNVVMREVIGDVVWDVGVEIVAGINKDFECGNGNSMTKKYYVNDVVMVINCSDIPVKFTADSAGNVTGSLLGNMRRCDYKTVNNLDM